MHPIALISSSSGLASCSVLGNPAACAALSAAGLAMILAGVFLADG
ncbi:MAG: hypothetical protein HY924_02790 [Elusimicrobia bacterium]|nr:hypothetical protein [Elusimicrobiota bacterium]